MDAKSSRAVASVSGSDEPLAPRRRTLVGVGALAAVSIATLVARPAPAQADSYRDELFVADATAVAVATIGRGEGPLGYLAGAGMWLGSPAVHLAHGNYGRAAGALALRGGSVLATYGVLRWCLDDGDEGSAVARCALGSLAVGAVLVGGAFAIDYAVLADDDDAPAAAPAQLTWRGTF
jgi:hypothetical protein